MALTKATMVLGSLDPLPKLTYASIRGYQSMSDVIYCVGRDNIFDGAQGVYLLDKNDTTSADDDGSILVDVKGRRWKRDDVNLNLSWYGLKYGGDILSPWNKAVAKVEAIVAAGGLRKRPTIYVDAGEYITTGTLSMSSWVSIVARGNVVVSASGLASNSYMLKITNTISGISPGSLSSDTIGSEGGNLLLVGPGKTGDVDGIFLGNSTSVSDVRNVKLRHVSVTGVRRSLTFGSINTYMFTAHDCHFEGSQVNVYLPNTTSANSGEKMVFNDTIFGGADAYHFYMATPGMDITCNGCSFDFTNGDVIYGAQSWGFAKLTLNDAHIEGYDGRFIYVEPRAGSGSSVGTNRSIMLNNVGNLPRLRTNIRAYNSPSRLKIDARDTPVFISGLDMRSEAPPYTEDYFLVGATTDLTIVGYIKDPYMHVPSVNHIMNMGYTMSAETIGTVVNSSGTMDALTAFTCTARNAATAEVVARDSGKMLKLTVSTGGSIRFASKQKLRVPPGEHLGLYSAISIASSTGTNRNLTPYMDWYDSAGNLISTTQGTSTNMNTVFEDSTVPNYAEGNARFIGSPLIRFRVPETAVECRPNWQFSGMVGDVYVSRMVICRLP